MALCTTTALARAVPCLCVRVAHGRSGKTGPVPVLVPPPPCFPLSSHPSRCVLRVALSGCPLPSPAGTLFHAVCAFCELGPVALPLPRCVCVCACAPAVCALPLLPVRRTYFVRYPCRALVGPVQVVRTPLRLLPWSCAPPV